MVTLTDRYPDLLKSSELASYLRISKSTLYRLVRSGRLPAARVGGRLRFRKDTISELLSDAEGQGWESWLLEKKTESPGVSPSDHQFPLRSVKV
jgi:excisionase family DNA binding protein